MSMCLVNREYKVYFPTSMLKIQIWLLKPNNVPGISPVGWKNILSCAWLHWITYLYQNSAKPPFNTKTLMSANARTFVSVSWTYRKYESLNAYYIYWKIPENFHRPVQRRTLNTVNKRSESWKGAPTKAIILALSNGNGFSSQSQFPSTSTSHYFRTMQDVSVASITYPYPMIVITECT